MKKIETRDEMLYVSNNGELENATETILNFLTTNDQEINDSIVMSDDPGEAIVQVAEYIADKFAGRWNAADFKRALSTSILYYFNLAIAHHPEGQEFARSLSEQIKNLIPDDKFRGDYSPFEELTPEYIMGLVTNASTRETN